MGGVKGNIMGGLQTYFRPFSEHAEMSLQSRLFGLDREDPQGPYLDGPFF